MRKPDLPEVPPPRRWHLMLGGTPAARLPDGSNESLALRDAALLAWLALEGPTSRTRLAQLLWPDSAPESAGNALRQRLFKLKHQLGVDVVGGVATLALAVGVTHDLDDADSVLGTMPGSIGAEFGTWLEQQRQRRRDRVRLSLAELCDMAERANDWADALTHAGELLALEPLSEAAHRRVMRLHYLAGDRAAALLAFDRCEQMLKDEVGARPSPETMALLQTIETNVESDGRRHTSVTVPVSVLRPPRMIGRGAELSAALHAWQCDRVFCLEGEAGMGKSRLLQEIVAHRPDTVCVQARPGDAVVPYATLVRMLRALLAHTPPVTDTTLQHALVPMLPELGGPARLGVGHDAGQRMALGKGVLDMVAAAHEAGVGALIVDDLHFADDASLEMLLQLARQAGGTAMRWGFARRAAEGSRVLFELNDALLEEQRLEPIALAPLTPEQLAELLGTLGLAPTQVEALAATLHRHSGGNPLFALETLRHAWFDTGLAGGKLPRPVSVTRLIERRLMRLSVPAMRLARCAAVAGVDFSIELAAAVLAVPAIDLADAWLELEHAQVLVDGGFAHDLIYETVRAGLPQPIARHLHGELARHLEQRAAAPASIAAHWLAAAAPASALPFLQRAGALASTQRRFVEAAAAYEREAQLRLELGDSEGAFTAALCMRKACFELDLAGRTDAALALLDRAAVTPVQRAQVCAERAVVAMHRGAMNDAEQAAVAGLAALETAAAPASPGLRADLHQHLAAVRVWQHRSEEAHGLLLAVEKDVEAAGDPSRRFEFVQALAVVLEHLDRPTESTKCYRVAADTALSVGNLPGAAQTLLNLAIGWRDSGRLDRALDTLEEAQAIITSLPEGAIPYSSLDLNFGIVLRDLGRYGEAMVWLDQAIERGRIHVPGWVSLFLGQRAQLWLALGQTARAQQDIDAAAVEGAPPLAQARRHLMHGQLLRLLGQDPVPAFDRAAHSIGAGGRALSRQRLVIARCVALDPADALAAAGEVLDAAQASHRIGLQFAARTRLCQAALALGHGAEAARHARHLVALSEADATDDLYRAELWLAAHQALAGPDPAQAAAVLRRAMTWLNDRCVARVPEPFRDGFMHRNPVNARLIALAAQST